MKPTHSHTWVKLLALSLTMILEVGSSRAATTTSGALSANDWSGTVTLRGDVTVPDNLTLTILPGTRVKSYSNEDGEGSGETPNRIELIVLGRLNAEGTAAEPIVFTSEPLVPGGGVAGDWYGLRFKVATNRASSLRFCTVENGEVGLHLQAGVVSVTDCTFRSNRVFGVRVNPSQALTLERCLVSGNNGGIDQQGDLLKCVNVRITANSIGLLARGAASQVVDSSIVGNGTGIEAETQSLTCTGTDISLNSKGVHTWATHTTFISCTISSNSNAGLDQNFVFYDPYRFFLGDCVFRSNGTQGATILGDGTVTNCVFEGNGSGLSLRTAKSRVVGSRFAGNVGGGIWVNGEGSTPDISVVGCRIENCGPFGVSLGGGAGNLTSSGGITGNVMTANTTGMSLYFGSAIQFVAITNNAIHGNTQFEIKNDGPGLVRAPGNYWGEPTTTELVNGVRNLSKVFDSRDDATKGQVLIATWLATDPSIHCDAPIIVTQPQDQEVMAGGSCSLAVAAQGTGIAFQWQRGSVKIPGETGSQLTLSGVQIAAAGLDYNVVVTGDCGSVTSRLASLTVLFPPEFTVHPLDQVVPVGTTARWHVAAKGTEPLSYRWQKDGVDLADGGRVSGAKTADLAVTTIQVSDAGSYRCVASNRVGSVTSRAGTLTVLTPPVLVAQPVSQVVAAGGAATFGVGATGAQLAYQWSLDGVAIPGATGATYGVPSASTNAVGQYTVTVTNPAGSVTSTAASLGLETLEVCAVITLDGPVGARYVVEWSEPLQPETWVLLSDVRLTSSPQVVVDYGSRHAQKRFYRTRVVTP